MATYLLDTSVIIDAINNKTNRRQLLSNLIEQGNTLACCPINITETPKLSCTAWNSTP
jgi:predicted nucleic acid-binding protein